MLIFLILSISLNYYYDFEDSIIDSYRRSALYIPIFFLFHCFAYYVMVLLQAAAQKDQSIFQNRQFWIWSLVGIFILSVDRGFVFTVDLARQFPRELQNYALKCLIGAKEIFTVILPLYLIYRLHREKDDSFYGLTFKGVKLKTYLQLFLLMIPIVVIAGQTPDFLKVYPKYNPYGAHEYFNCPEWIIILIYEFFYGLSFLSVELLFRGFLIIGLAKWIGKEALLPMVVLYAFIHFGKPLGETIGSVFGGYILGVLALYSKNIWGGVTIHLGIAWLMEIVAGLKSL